MIHHCFNFVTEFYSNEQACQLFGTLEKTLKWEQKSIIIFGKSVPQPRLVAFYAHQGLSYSYSGLTNIAGNFTPELLQILYKIRNHTGFDFNSVLANYYRNGFDSMGWHRDNEPELGPNPVIASLSLGQPRRFLVRTYKTHLQKTEWLLTNGSLLIMKNQSQSLYEHCVPKSNSILQPRINLTFRNIIN